MIKEIEINILNVDDKTETIREVKKALLETIESVEKEYKKITFLCIGTDKVIVDSVGPVIGSSINKNLNFVEVLGKLEDTVNALNVEEIALSIDEEENLIIVIDACVSTKKEIGTVVIANKPLLPGKGMGKYLGEYGDISVKVVVSDDCDDFFRGTSLGLILKMTDVVTKAINGTLEEITLREASLTIDKYIKSDPYTNEDMVLNRLRKEYKKYGKLIIAYDFDYTINNYRDENWEYTKVVQLLKDWKGRAEFICYTASSKDRYKEIKNKAKELDIKIDCINKNIKGMRVPKGGKIFYNIFLDDRAGLDECARVLRKLITEIKKEEEQSNES